jgi:hypothetical protein
MISMKQAAKKSGGKPLIIILSVVALLLIILGILFGLALSDPNEPITPGTKASAGAAKLVASVATGVPARLSCEEANDIVAARLAKSEQTKVKSMRFTINSDHTVNAYLPVEYKGMKFGMNANVTLSAADEKQICATVNSMNIGRLPVNPAWALQNGKAVLPKDISVDGNALHINTRLLDTYVLEDMVGININSLMVEDQSFVVGVSGNLDKLKGYIEQNLKSYIGLLG